MKRIMQMPIFAPINIFVIVVYNLFYIFPRYLFGSWYCEDCRTWYRWKDEKISTQHADICETCYKREYGGDT